MHKEQCIAVEVNSADHLSAGDIFSPQSAPTRVRRPGGFDTWLKTCPLMTLPLCPTGKVVGSLASRTIKHHDSNGDSVSEGEQKVTVEDAIEKNQHTPHCVRRQHAVLQSFVRLWDEDTAHRGKIWLLPIFKMKRCYQCHRSCECSYWLGIWSEQKRLWKLEALDVAISSL